MSGEKTTAVFLIAGELVLLMETGANASSIVVWCDNYFGQYFGQTDTPDGNDFVAIAATERVHYDLATRDPDCLMTVQQWVFHSNWEWTFSASRTIRGVTAKLRLWMKPTPPGCSLPAPVDLNALSCRFCPSQMSPLNIRSDCILQILAMKRQANASSTLSCRNKQFLTTSTLLVRQEDPAKQL